MTKVELASYQREYYKKNKEKMQRQHREWSAANKDKIIGYRKKSSLKLRNYLLKKKFNISLEDYNALLEKQNGTCAICSVTHSHGRRLSVDHCHKTGNIRGLLCAQHNTALGSFQDKIQDLYKAIKYLEEADRKTEILTYQSVNYK